MRVAPRNYCFMQYCKNDWTVDTYVRRYNVPAKVPVSTTRGLAEGRSGSIAKDRQGQEGFRLIEE
jgi:hypothetical protein